MLLVIKMENENNEVEEFMNRINAIKYRYRNQLAILHNLSYAMDRDLREIESLSNDFKKFHSQKNEDITYAGEKNE